MRLTFVVIKSRIQVPLFATSWTVAPQASLSSTISCNLLKVMSIESVIPFNHLTLCHPLFLLPSVFLSIRSFPLTWLFASSGQSIGASASVLPMNIQGWFPLGLTGLISMQSKWLSRGLSSTTTRKHKFSGAQPSYGPLSNLCMTMEKTIALTIQTFIGKVLSLLFNILSRFVIAFLSRRKNLLISWLQLSSCSDFGAQENKVCHCFHCFPIYLPWSNGTGCHDLSFNVEFKARFFTLLFHLHQEAL